MPLAEVSRKQVSLLVKALPLVAAETAFALKGGTAINLFLRDMPRGKRDAGETGGNGGKRGGETGRGENGTGNGRETAGNENGGKRDGGKRDGLNAGIFLGRARRIRPYPYAICPDENESSCRGLPIITGPRRKLGDGKLGDETR